MCDCVCLVCRIQTYRPQLSNGNRQSVKPTKQQCSPTSTAWQQATAASAVAAVNVHRLAQALSLPSLAPYKTGSGLWPQSKAGLLVLHALMQLQLLKPATTAAGAAVQGSIARRLQQQLQLQQAVLQSSLVWFLCWTWPTMQSGRSTSIGWTQPLARSHCSWTVCLHSSSSSSQLRSNLVQHTLWRIQAHNTAAAVRLLNTQGNSSTPNSRSRS